MPNEGLKRIFAEHKRENLQEIQDKFRDVRAEAEWKETSEELGAWGIFHADTQQDIVALIQMKAETLDQINQALSRLDEGAYGYVSSAARRFLSGACVRCPSRFGARTARRRWRWRRSASGTGS
jgi:RNA polymerase-binding transcription factor DksA